MGEEQELGSVGLQASPVSPSPSLANEPATPSEEVLADRLARAWKTAGRLQSQLSAAEKARRTAAPDCGRGKHDIEQIVGNVFTIYRCRRCLEEEWL